MSGDVHYAFASVGWQPESTGVPPIFQFTSSALKNQPEPGFGLNQLRKIGDRKPEKKTENVSPRKLTTIVGQFKTKELKYPQLWAENNIGQLILDRKSVRMLFHVLAGNARQTFEIYADL